MDLDLASMRAKYNDEHSNFTEDKLSSTNPFVQFKEWMEEASQNPKIEEANAMCISTVSPSGRPSSRMVLLKGFSEETGFRFFTNTRAEKVLPNFLSLINSAVCQLVSLSLHCS